MQVKHTWIEDNSQRKARLWRIRVLIVAIVAAGVTCAAMFGTFRVAAPTTANSPQSAPEVMAYPAVPPNATITSAPAAPWPAPEAPSRQTAAPRTLREVVLATSPEQRHAKVAALMASGNSKDALEAARIIGWCKRAKYDEVSRAQTTDEQSKQLYAEMPNVDEACSGLDPGQEGAYARLIIQAVESGVPNAFAYVQRTANNDEEVDGQYQRLMQAAIDAGDPGAMWTGAMSLSAHLTCGKNDEHCSAAELAQALSLFEAAKQVLGSWPPKGRPDPIPLLVDRLDHKQPGLSAEAIEKGKALASNKRRTTR